VKKVLIPEENAKDLVDLPASVKNGLEIVPVSRMDEVIQHALVRQPEPITWEEDLASAKAQARCRTRMDRASWRIDGSARRDHRWGFRRDPEALFCPGSRFCRDLRLFKACKVAAEREQRAGASLQATRFD
jgi:hypothetical protein